MEKVKVYCFRDKQGSIIGLNSSFLLGDVEGIEVLFEIDEADEDYELAKSVINQEFVLKKYGQYLLDENLRPNYHSNFKMWTDEEKERLYPEIEKVKQLSEQDLINADIYMQIAILQMQGVSTMSISIKSPRYELLKKYYDIGIYDDNNIEIFVICGWITEDEYTNITNKVLV